MTRYLIDIRLMGPVKEQIRRLSDELQQVSGPENRLVTPHITLAGPFSTDDEPRLVADFTRICTAVGTVPRYEAGGYGFFDTTGTVVVIITPDEALKQFRYRLARAIAPYCRLREYDHDSADAFRFHATLAMKLDRLTLLRMRWHFRHRAPVVHRHHPIRATLLRNAKILCEYDFLQGRMLTRSQALSRATYRRDLDMLRAYGCKNP